MAISPVVMFGKVYMNTEGLGKKFFSSLIVSKFRALTARLGTKVSKN